MSQSTRLPSQMSGPLEFLTTLAIRSRIYPRLFAYPELLKLVRRFDQLPFKQKRTYVENFVRGFMIRRLLTQDSGIPLLTKGTRITTENGGRVKLGKFVEFHGAKVYVGSRGNPGDGLLTIGDRTIISHTRINVIAPLTIGANCLVAASSIMTTNFHHLDGIYGFKLDAPITIADHVWVCEGAILLPGTNIGRDTVIGAGAVVSGHVPPNVLVGANKATVVRALRGWHA